MKRNNDTPFETFLCNGNDTVVDIDINININKYKYK